VLLAAKKPDEAEAVYREDLVKYPENGWALRGLATALAMKKKAGEAARVEKRFEAAWARADVDLESSCFCVRKGRTDAPLGAAIEASVASAATGHR
jgi:hypothetical protein